MKAIKQLAIFLLLVLFVVTQTSCTKEEGFGGKAPISGTVSYPDGTASGAIIYIAYGTKEATSVYDHSTTADANGHYELGGLQPGDYFVDAQLKVDKGNFDVEFNSPGYGVTIGESKADITLDIELN